MTTDKPEIEYAIVLTSCARFDLLRKSVESLLQFADVRPTQFIVVEDSGDEKVREVLAEFDYPFEIIIREPGIVPHAPYGQGHARQAAAIDAGYARVKTELVFHMQDDWLFFRTGFIRESAVILRKFPKVSYVALRGRRDGPGYANLPYREEDGVMFYIIDPKIVRTHFGIGYNPGLRRMSDYRLVCPVSAIGNEGLVGMVFQMFGFYEAALEIPAVLHLGWGRRTLKKTHSKTIAGWVRRGIQRFWHNWHKYRTISKWRAIAAKSPPK